MALAFFCHHMHQNRPANLAVFQIAQNRQQMFKIMAIYRANMEKAQLAEQAVPADQITGQILCPSGGLFDFCGNRLATC